MTILLLAEHDHQTLRSATLNALTAARQLADRTGLPIHILVAGHRCDGAVAAAARLPGVAKVLHVEDEAYAEGLAENLAALIVQLAGDARYILAASTSYGKNVLPRVAALLDVAQISDVIAIDDADVFVRPIYAGNALATVRSLDPVKILTVRAAAFDAAASDGGQAVIETRPATGDKGHVTFIGREISKSERPELGAARIVISGGRGLQSGENFKLLEAVADKLNAAIGASRAAVDAGFVPNDYQVGQTGKIVAPDLYIAVGISGAIQHLAGMKDSKVIVAINKDAEAPIFQVADYGLVADLFQALPELAAELDKK